MLDRTLSTPPGQCLATRSGTELKLRPVGADDGALVADLFDNLGPEGLRFRFLTGMAHISAEHVANLVEVDHRHTEHLLAFAEDSSSPVGSLMIAADLEMQSAEVAIAVAQGCRGKGIGYALLRHATSLARSRGITVLRAIESRAHHDAIEVERALGFAAKPYDGDATLVLLEAQLS